MKIFNKVLERFLTLIKKHNLLKENIKVKMSPLKPSEVIGYPKRDDYPLLQGKEVMIEADFKGYKGQAFTDEPFDFEGKLYQIVNLKFQNNRERAILIATLNAVLRYLGNINDTVHCKNEEPEECAKLLTEKIFNEFGNVKITLVGLQPSFAHELIKKFGISKINILDLNPQNIGKNFEGVVVQDSKINGINLIKNSDLTIATGSTIVNDTIDTIIENSNNIIFYGVTISGASKLLNLKRLCLKAH